MKIYFSKVHTDSPTVSAYVNVDGLGRTITVKPGLPLDNRAGIQEGLQQLAGKAEAAGASKRVVANILGAQQ